MSQQEAFSGQAHPNGQSNMAPLRAPNDVRYKGHNGPGANGSASQAGVGVPVPRGPGHAPGGSIGGANGQAFVGARSPPNAKNTSHVPCKFYKQGTCQAGNTCPFLHADNTGPCKYFQKGNCKFGMRCANDHITPDGRRVNKQAGLNMAAQMQMGARMVSPMQPQPGAFGMSHDDFGQPYYPTGAGMEMPMPLPTMYNVPTIEATEPAPQDEYIGSPPSDRYMGRSPPGRGISLLDAPLPASFDSQGISVFARHGPIAKSVPTRFGLEASPPPFSHLHGQDSSQSPSTVNTYASAFADGSQNVNLLSMSPSGNDGPPQRIGIRQMHSATYSRPKVLSSSVGNRRYLGGGDEDDDLEFDSMFEEAVPSSLHDLLTPQERLRRLSRTAEDDSPSGHRAALSGLGTPGGASPKIGSPGVLGASPSRYGSLFQRQQRDRDAATNDSPSGSAFGHVGSPLRSSLLNPGSSPALRAVNGRPTSGEFSISSPPRATNGSLIAQHLQRSRLSHRTDSAESTSLHHPGVQRVASSSSANMPPGRLDRTVSTASSTGFVGHDKIDEEDGLFAMEGLNISDAKNKRAATNAVMTSGGGSGGGGMWATVAREGAERERKAMSQQQQQSQKQQVGVIGGNRTTSVQSNGTMP